ncbi:MAG TPA: N-acetylmannosamine-6-phosphate 2-epimerase, partial [Trueperaceae bacterium]
LPSGLVVSCQAPDASPLAGPIFMAAMARAAQQAGAIGIRADGPEDIRAIREAASLPVIGIHKRRDLDPDVYITPTLREVERVHAAGARIVALDATRRPRPGGGTAAHFIRTIKKRYPELLLMADISDLEEGVAAASAGADLVATTLSGYTLYSRPGNGPDLELVEALADAVAIPVVAEGRYQQPGQVREAFDRGAYAVVVGTAITNPLALAERFVNAVPKDR